jgi:hypothetical protein
MTDASAAPAGTDPTRSVRATLKGISAVVAPTSALTALLYYFGWTRSAVEANRLGLDESLLGYSTQDYLLRSMSSMYAPLVVGLIVTLVGVGLHTLIVGWARRLGLAGDAEAGDGAAQRRMGRLIAALAAFGLASVVMGYTGTRVPQPSRALYLAGPVAVTGGILILVYAAGLYRRFLASRGDGGGSMFAGYDGLVASAVVMLVLITLFWSVSRYAVVKGNELADQIEALVPQRPGVIVYSEKRLYLQPPVVETRLDPENAAYNYAYSGLKLLFRADGKYFLRPSDSAAQVNILIPDGLDIRLELFHP